MPEITFSGLASGLDSAAIIRSLVAVERRPIQAKQARKQALQRNLTLFSDVAGKLAALRDRAADLRKPASFSSLQAVSGDTTVLTASATGAAGAGVHQVEVNQLASRETETSQGYADANTTTVGTGTLRITVGSTTTDVPIGAGGDSLAEVRDAIRASGAAVTATIVNDGTASPYRLVVTAKEGGDENAVTIDVSGLTGGDQALVFTQTQDALDAIVKVGGIEIHRNSNRLDDVLEGVTIDLLKEAPGTPVTLRLEADVSGLTEDVKKFVDAYNDVMSLVGRQLRFAPGQEAPPLLGDFTLRSLQSRLRSAVTGAVSADPGDPDSLAAIGIKTSSSGTLSIDTEDLEDAIEADPEAIVSLFVDGAGEIAKSVESLARTYVRPADGLIPGRRDALQKTIRRIDDDVRKAEARVAAFEAAQRRRFAALESLVSQLQSQSAFALSNSPTTRR